MTETPTLEDMQFCHDDIESEGGVLRELDGETAHEHRGILLKMLVEIDEYIQMCGMLRQTPSPSRIKLIMKKEGKQ